MIMPPRTDAEYQHENMTKLEKKGNRKRGGKRKGQNNRNDKSERQGQLKSPLSPTDKSDSWWQTMKSQLHFIMTGKGKPLCMITENETIIALDPAVSQDSLGQKKSIIRSLLRKLTPTLMKYTPGIFNIKPPKSPERNIQDWLEAMPEPEKCKTDDTVESLWWPTTEEKVTELITQAPNNIAYIPRRERKPGKVDPLLKMYSNTTQLVPFKECSRSLVDLRTLETKRKNRQCPKNRFSKNIQNESNAHIVNGEAAQEERVNTT